jgi:serine/threonine-protein kinase
VANGGFAKYSPSGHLVFALGGALHAVSVEPDSLEPRGPALPVLDELDHDSEFAWASFDLSPSGSLVYSTGAGREGLFDLVWVDRQGREELLPAEPRTYVYPRISPDGRRVALDVRDEDEGEIWIWDFEREDLSRLTNHPMPDSYSVWTADGEQIYFASGRERVNDFSIYRVAADGAGAPELVYEAGGFAAPYAFTASASALLFRSGVGRQDLALLHLDGEPRVESLLATEARELNGEISPDGRWLAYQSDESGEDEIYVRSFPDVQRSRRKVSRAGGVQPLWGPTGDELFYRTEDRLMRVAVRAEGASFEIDSPETLFRGSFFLENLETVGRTYDISPDGERFLMIKPRLQEGSDSNAKVVLVQNWTRELERLVPAP